MIDTRLFVHAIFLTIAPIIVAWFGWSVPAAILFVILLLLWRWIVVLSRLVAPPKTPELVLATISASHFVEKVRWCMDQLGIEYVERPSGGTLGVFFRGRTVPQLNVRTGAVQSVIGNSPEILRYLWGRYEVDDPAAAAFLRPSSERIELEARLDQYGVSLQVWVYYHLLKDRALALHAWGADNPATPSWQRLLLRLLFPLLALLIRRSFRIDDMHYQKSVSRIETLLADIEAKLEDGRSSILDGNDRNFTDFAFASMTGLWLMPQEFGGGRADAVRIERDRAPEEMRRDIDAWQADFPRAVGFVERLYANERGTPG